MPRGSEVVADRSPDTGASPLPRWSLCPQCARSPHASGALFAEDGRDVWGQRQLDVEARQAQDLEDRSVRPGDRELETVDARVVLDERGAARSNR
jgi:hypothetical protein